MQPLFVFHYEGRDLCYAPYRLPLGTGSDVLRCWELGQE